MLLTESKNILIASISRSDTGFGKTAPRIATSLGGFAYDAWVVMLDSYGNQMWDKAYSGYSGAIPFDMELKDPNTIIIGSNIRNGGDTLFDITAPVTPGTINSSGAHGIWLLAIDTLGNKLWNKRFAPGSPAIPGTIQGCDLESDSTGIYIVGTPRKFPLFGGDFTASNCAHDGWDVLAFKIPDTSFNAQWQQLYGGDSSDVVQRLIKLMSGELLIGGKTRSVASCNQTVSNWNPGFGYYDIYLVKINADGDTLDQWHFGGNNTDILIDIVETRDKGIVLYGFSYSNQGYDVSQSLFNDSTLWVVKLDSTGNKLWDKRYAPCQGLQLYTSTSASLLYESHNLALQTMDGGLLFAATLIDSAACGDVTENGRGVRDYWVFKTDDNGNMLWDKRFGGSNNDIAESLAEVDTGIYIVGGYSNSQAGGDKSDSRHGNLGWDIWLICFKDTSSITGLAHNIPEQLSLGIYPNPAMNSCTIIGNHFVNATITIYDITGRALQQQLFNNKGQIDVSKLASGVYVAEVRSKQGVEKARLVKQ